MYLVSGTELYLIVLQLYVLCIMPHLGNSFAFTFLFHTSWFVFLGWRLCFAVVPATLALDLPTWITPSTSVFLSHCLTPHNLYIYVESGRTAGVVG